MNSNCFSEKYLWCLDRSTVHDAALYKTITYFLQNKNANMSAIIKFGAFNVTPIRAYINVESVLTDCMKRVAWALKFELYTRSSPSRSANTGNRFLRKGYVLKR